MTVILTKGMNTNLTKDNPGLKTLKIGLGWDVNGNGKDFDLDAMAFLVKADGKVSKDENFIYFGRKEAVDGSVIHSGDNLTGVGAGDDETITVDLTKVSTDVEKIVIAINIYEAQARNQNFGQVKNAYCRVLDGTTELVKYDLTEDFSGETAIVFAELYRNNGEFKFKAIGEGYKKDLNSLAREFGVNV